MNECAMDECAMNGCAMSGGISMKTSLYNCLYSAPHHGICHSLLCPTPLEITMSAIELACEEVEELLCGGTSFRFGFDESSSPFNQAMLNASLKGHANAIASLSIPSSVQGSDFRAKFSLIGEECSELSPESLWSMKLHGLLTNEDNIVWPLTSVIWTAEVTDDGSLHFKDLQAGVPTSDKNMQFLKETKGMDMVGKV